MTRLIHPTADQRTAQKAKQHVDALMRQGARGDVLKLAWQAPAETVQNRKVS